MKSIADIKAIREKMQGQINLRDNQDAASETRIVVGMATWNPSWKCTSPAKSPSPTSTSTPTRRVRSLPITSSTATSARNI